MPFRVSQGSAVIAIGAGATAEVIASPGAGHRLYLEGVVGHVDRDDTSVTLKTASTAFTGAISADDDRPVEFQPSGDWQSPWFKCAENEAFNITTTTGTFDGAVMYSVVRVP